ncbi:MAG: FAD-binding protein, partial [bacterium]|nr:FAD-binding protein [bacterium]
MTMANPALATAYDNWIRVVGRDAVQVAPDIGAEWSSATIRWPARPMAVISPGHSDHVSACLAIANAAGIPVHPVSRGRSWGLGSRLPPRDAVILDLSRLDRILDLDIKRGTARIE